MYYYPYPPPRIRDYTPTATLILFLYLLVWIPGLIVNLVMLVVASFEKDSYDQVHGYGCLVALLLVGGFGPPVVFGLAYFFVTHLSSFR